MAARIALTLLTLNEIEGVQALLPQLADLNALGVDQVFAIDGGSTDGTLEWYSRYGVRVHPQNSRGRGEAMRMAAACTNDDFLIFFSPDGNEDLNDIAKFRPLFEKGYDLVIASRMMEGARNEEDGHWFRPRKWANNVFNWAGNSLFRRCGEYVTDSINGFRGLRRGLLQELELDAVGYTVEYQMTLRALERGLKIAEFPTQEGARIGGQTKAPSIPIGIKFVGCLWKEFQRSRRHPLSARRPT